jgi:hypothetical protein
MYLLKDISMTPYGDQELFAGYEAEISPEQNHLEEMGNQLVVFEHVQDEAPAEHVNMDEGQQFNAPAPHEDPGFYDNVCSFFRNSTFRSCMLLVYFLSHLFFCDIHS